MRKYVVVGLAMSLGLAPRSALAQRESDFASLLSARATNAPGAPYDLADQAPSGFRDYLSKWGAEAGLTNSRAEFLYEKFKEYGQVNTSPPTSTPEAIPREGPAQPPASLAALKGAEAGSSSGFFDGAKRLMGSPWAPHIAGLEVGTGPHPNADISQALDATAGPGWDIRGRAELDGLGARVAIRPPSFPPFEVSFLKYTDLVGAMNADSARDTLYKVFLSYPQTPLAGYQASLTVSPDPHVTLYTSQDDKTYLDSSNAWNRHVNTGVGAGVRPLGDNNGKSWNFTIIAAPGVERRQTGSPNSPIDKKGALFAGGASVQYALDKLPVKWLQPPPVGNGVVWPDYVKTTVEAIASELTGAAVAWSSELSFHVTKYLQLTPGVQTLWRPLPVAVPVLGIDLQNPR